MHVSKLLAHITAKELIEIYLFVQNPSFDKVSHIIAKPS